MSSKPNVSKPNVRLEAAIFFAAACFVMVLAANLQVVVHDLAGLLGIGDAQWTGAAWRVIVVGVVVAAVAYGGALVVLIPIYDFLIQVLQKLERKSADSKQDAGEPSKRTARRRDRPRHGSRGSN